jgi:hypothetical protein
VRQVTRASNEQHNFDSFQLHSLKASFSLLVIKSWDPMSVLNYSLQSFFKLFSHFAGEMQ